VLSGRGLCDGLITRPEESYRLWYVVMCDPENSRMKRPWPSRGGGGVGWGAKKKKKKKGEGGGKGGGGGGGASNSQNRHPLAVQGET